MTTLLKGITRLALNEVLRKSSLKKLWYGRKVKIRIFDFNFEICSKNTKYFLSNNPETKNQPNKNTENKVLSTFDKMYVRYF